MYYDTPTFTPEMLTKSVPNGVVRTASLPVDYGLLTHTLTSKYINKYSCAFLYTFLSRLAISLYLIIIKLVL